MSRKEKEVMPNELLREVKKGSEYYEEIKDTVTVHPTFDIEELVTKVRKWES